MTVDWSRWMEMSAADQAALWARYRKIVREESERAFQSRYGAMNAAIRDPYNWRLWFRE